MLLIDTETWFSPDIMWRLFLYNQTHTHTQLSRSTRSTGRLVKHSHSLTHTHTHARTNTHAHTRSLTHAHTCLQINRANNPAHIAAITQHRSGERERDTMNFTSHRTLTSTHWWETTTHSPWDAPDTWRNGFDDCHHRTQINRWNTRNLTKCLIIRSNDQAMLPTRHI